MMLGIRHKLLAVGASVLLNGGALLAAAHVFSVKTPISDPEIVMEVSLEPYFLSENVSRQSEAPPAVQDPVQTPPQEKPSPQTERMEPAQEEPPKEAPSSTPPVRLMATSSRAPAAPATSAVSAPAQGSASTSEPAIMGPPAPVVSTSPAVGKAGRNHSVAYSALVRRHLEMFRDYPRTAKRRREEGVVTVTFVINRQGRVLNVKVGKTSGYAALDQAALDMVRTASPLPAPPSDIGGEQIEMTVPAEFFLTK
ncbi:MAG: energy transducer TonB [Asticcacaulis sp.]